MSDACGEGNHITQMKTLYGQCYASAFSKTTDMPITFLKAKTIIYSIVIFVEHIISQNSGLLTFVLRRPSTAAHIRPRRLIIA